MRSLQEVFAYLFDIKDVLVSKLNKATNVIQVQLGDSTAEVPDSDAAAWWQHTGFASMAAAPTKGGASCQALVLKRGDRDIAFASRDTRGSAIYGQMKPGETCVYAPGARGRILCKANGDNWMLTELGNEVGGATLAIHQGSDGSITLQGAKAVIQATADGTITIGNGACAITLDPSGKIHLVGVIVQAQASGVAMISGDVATLLGPNASPTPAGAVAVTVAGPANVVSTNVFASL